MFSICCYAYNTSTIHIYKCYKCFKRGIRYIFTLKCPVKPLHTLLISRSQVSKTGKATKSRNTSECNDLQIFSNIYLIANNTKIHVSRFEKYMLILNLMAETKKLQQEHHLFFKQHVLYVCFSLECLISFGSYSSCVALWLFYYWVMLL